MKSRNKMFTKKKEWGQGQVKVIAKDVQCQKGHTILNYTFYRPEKPDKNWYISHTQEMWGSGLWKETNTLVSAKVVAETTRSGLHQPACSELGLGSLRTLGTIYLGFILISPLHCFSDQFGMSLYTHNPLHASPCSCLGVSTEIPSSVYWMVLPKAAGKGRGAEFLGLISCWYPTACYTMQGLDSSGPTLTIWNLV